MRGRNDVADTAGRWQISSVIIVVEGVAGELYEEGEGRLKNCGFRKSHHLRSCVEVGELGWRNF